MRAALCAEVVAGDGGGLAAAVYAVRVGGAATAGWLGIPLVIGGIGWELLQGVLAMICLLARRLGKLEKLVEIKR